MRLIITICLLSLIISCKNGSKSIQTTVAQPEVQAISTPKTTEKAIGEGPYTAVPIDLSAVKPCSASRKAYLSTAYWACFGAQHPNDDVYAAQVEGVKLQFSEDMTFKIYRGRKLVLEGTWAYDESKDEAYLSSKDPYLNSSFKNQEKGFRMIWLGNTELNKSGVQIRWDNHKKLED